MLRSRFISLLAITSASLAGCATRNAPVARLRFSVRRDVTYTPAGWPSKQLADLHLPEANTPTPAVLLIHGGGWNGRESRHDMEAIARALVKRGYFVMNATYRLTPEWKFPAQTDDLEQAIRFMSENSRELNIDTSRIATFGYSAGGHLAALSGLDPANGVKAIVVGGAPADLSFWPDGKLTGLLLGGPVKGNEEIYRKASPVHHVAENSPPVFIYHGDRDNLVPPAHAEALIASLRKNGVEHEVYRVEGRSHILTHLFSADAIPRSIAFLDNHLGNKARS